jgi:hypothetical protein
MARSFWEGCQPPFLSGLGEESDSAQAAALREYAVNAKAAAQVAADVARLRPANFGSEVTRLSRAVHAYLDHYEKFVHEKTGNEEAERQLRHVWVAINRELTAAIQKWPSVTEQVLDKVVRFIEDFSAAVKETWKNYMSWAVKNAGDALRLYHTAVVRVRRARREKVPDPEGDLPQAEALLERARALFRAVAGADLDELAQKEYGPYPALGAVWALPVSAIIGLVLILAIVVAATVFVNRLWQGPTSLGGYAVLGVAGLAALAMLLGNVHAKE